MTKGKKNRKAAKAPARPRRKSGTPLPRQEPSPKRTIAVRLTIDRDRALRSLAREYRQTVTAIVISAVDGLIASHALRHKTDLPYRPVFFADPEVPEVDAAAANDNSNGVGHRDGDGDAEDAEDDGEVDEGGAAVYGIEPDDISDGFQIEGDDNEDAEGDDPESDAAPPHDRSGEEDAA